MIPALFAQTGVGSGDALIHLVISALIVIGVVVIGVIVIRWMGVTIPPQLIQIFWVVLAVVVGIIAIHYLWSMAW